MQNLNPSSDKINYDFFAYACKNNNRKKKLKNFLN